MVYVRVCLVFVSQLGDPVMPWTDGDHLLSIPLYLFLLALSFPLSYVIVILYFSISLLSLLISSSTLLLHTFSLPGRLLDLIPCRRF